MTVDPTKISRDLAEIILLEQPLLAQAVNTASASVEGHSLPGGNAMVSLAPVAAIVDWERRIELREQAWWRRLLEHSTTEPLPDLTSDEDDTWQPALQTLRAWSDRYRRALGMDYDHIPTIGTEAAFLRHETVLSWIVANEPNLELFAEQINLARRRLENVVHAGSRAERTRVECNQCLAKPQLIKVYGNTEEDDRWKCPRCKHRYDADALKRAHAEQLRRATAAKYVDWHEARATLVALGRSERTIRKWMAVHVEEVDRCAVCRHLWPRQEYATCPRKITRGDRTGEWCGGDLEQTWRGDGEAVVQAYSDISTHRLMVWWPDIWTLHLTTATRRRAG